MSYAGQTDVSAATTDAPESSENSETGRNDARGENPPAPDAGADAGSTKLSNRRSDSRTNRFGRLITFARGDGGQTKSRRTTSPRTTSRRTKSRRAIVEVVAAFVTSLIATIVTTWPAVLHLRDRIPGDSADPTLLSWALAWVGHALRTDPGMLWNSNIFWPLPNTFALSETLLGYAPLALLGSGPQDAVVRYNVLFLLVPALTAAAAYALVRQLGARASAACLAAVVCTWAPWRFAHIPHLHILSTAGMLFAFAMVARGNGYTLTGGFVRGNVRPLWIVLGWLVAGWQLTVSWTVGLPFAYSLAAVVVIAGVGWLIAGRPALPKRLWVSNVVGGLAFGVIGLLMAGPYLRVTEQYSGAIEKRASELPIYSAKLASFVAAPPESWLWGGATAGARAGLYDSVEMWLFPGAVVVVLAVVGLVLSRWSVRARVTMAVSAVVLTGLAMGTNFAGGAFYNALGFVLPGWSSSRTPGRLIGLVTVLLAILAAGAFSRILDLLRQRASSRRTSQGPARGRGWRPKWRLLAAGLATLLVPMLAFAEGVGPVHLAPVPAPPRAYVGATGPLLMLPSGAQYDPALMLWSTDGFPVLRNGYSGYVPHQVLVSLNQVRGFPNATTVRYLRGLGVRTVVVDLRTIKGTNWEKAPTRTTDGLPMKVTTFPDSIRYDLT